MVIDKFTFFRGASAIDVSDNLINTGKGSALTLEVSGDSTSFSLSIQGIVEDENNEDWTDLATINMTDLEVSDEIAKKGIYSIGCDGIVKIRANLNTIDNGSITVIGKLND